MSILGTWWNVIEYGRGVEVCDVEGVACKGSGIGFVNSSCGIMSIVIIGSNFMHVIIIIKQLQIANPNR